jgi:hypothetical protein
LKALRWTGRQSINSLRDDIFFMEDINLTKFKVYLMN